MWTFPIKSFRQFLSKCTSFSEHLHMIEKAVDLVTWDKRKYCDFKKLTNNKNNNNNNSNKQITMFDV